MAAKLHLKVDYRGWASGEQVIPAGVYDQKDPILRGNADYFVNVMGLGEWLEPNEPEPVVEVPPVEEWVEPTPDLRHADEIAPEIDVEVKAKRSKAK
jgi:hypothetical protein